MARLRKKYGGANGAAKFEVRHLGPNEYVLSGLTLTDEWQPVSSSKWGEPHPRFGTVGDRLKLDRHVEVRQIGLTGEDRGDSSGEDDEEDTTIGLNELPEG